MMSLFYNILGGRFIPALPLDETLTVVYLLHCTSNCAHYSCDNYEFSPFIKQPAICGMNFYSPSQVRHEGDPEAALVQFSSPGEATKAHNSAEAVLSNRFIKVFYLKQNDLPRQEVFLEVCVFVILLNNYNYLSTRPQYRWPYLYVAPLPVCLPLWSHLVIRVPRLQQNPHLIAVVWPSNGDKEVITSLQKW